MTKRIGMLIVGCICALMLSRVNSQSQYNIERSFEIGGGKKIKIDLDTGGDIRISGSSGNSVVVRGNLIGRDAEKIEVDVREVSGGIEIISRYTGRGQYRTNLEFDITVPQQFNVAIESSGGEVHIDGVEGDFNGRTMGGSLDLINLKGNASLKTMGGDILVSDSDLEGRVETMGGEVILRNVSGGVKGSTMGGNVRYENTTGSTSVMQGGSEISLNSMGGDLEISEAPAGARLETMGGDIRIQSASKYVFAKTMGGDIEVKSIDGKVDATTMGGDVKIRMTGNPASGERDATITSMGGDIELIVPEGLDMTIDLETSFESRSRKPKIISDFPVEQEEYEKDDWDGDLRWAIHATGKTGAGTHHIKIRTVEGNIILKRG